MLQSLARFDSEGRVSDFGLPKAELDLIIDQATTIGLLPATPMLISYDAPTRPQRIERPRP